MLHNNSSVNPESGNFYMTNALDLHKINSKEKKIKAVKNL